MKFVLDQRLTTIPQHTWVTKLFGCDLSVEYRSDKLNTVADALSCRDEDQGSLLALSAPTIELYEALRAEFRTDVQATTVREELANGQASEGWSEADGLLLFKGRIFVPDASTLWPTLLAHAHDAGHEGTQKTLHRWRATFFNAHALRRVREFVRGCSVCQRNKSEHLHPAGLLQPLPVPSEVWAYISMDFIEAFLKVGDK